MKDEKRAWTEPNLEVLGDISTLTQQTDGCPTGMIKVSGIGDTQGGTCVFGSGGSGID